MLLTREADYAVRCVVEVARSGRTSAARVAKAQGISPTFLGKIVRSLARAGILATRRGVGGGIMLAQPIEDISMIQVIEAIGGPLCIKDCLQTPPQCEHVDGCPAYPYLRDAQDRLRESLDVSIARLLAGPDVASEPAAPILAPMVLKARAGNGNGQRKAGVASSTPRRDAP
jgi:Rrf2 family protein